MSRFPIIVRMDDIHPWMDMNKFNKYVCLFERLDIKPLLGIIPCCEDSSIKKEYNVVFWDRIHDLKNKGWEISMHGYKHVYTSKARGRVCKRKQSEFAGYSIEYQREILREGKKALAEHNIFTTVFMPPGHSYDNTTLCALREEGFTFLSDGRSKRPYFYKGIKCIPARGSYRLHRSGVLTICVHADKETEDDYIKLKKFLIENREQVITFDDATKLECDLYFKALLQEHISLISEIIINKIYKLKHYYVYMSKLLK